MAKSVVPLVIVLLASSLALSNANGIDKANNVFCQDKADGLYPDTSDSHSFYHCSNSLTYHKQCPANLVFNPAKNRCDWDVVNSAFCQDKADGLYPDPLDSHSFFQCSNSLTYHKQCPANLVFNPAISVCDWPVVNSAFCQDKADGMYADPSDSHSFYHCSNCLTYHKQCPANLVFNPAKNICDWDVVNSVFCQDKADGLYPDPLDSHSFYHCSNSLTYHKQCPANLVFNPAISVCDWPGTYGNVAAATTQATTKSVVNSVFCQDKADGLYPDPLDSHSFYHCSNSLTYHKQCPANLVFNPAISVCDWPGNVAAATTQATTKSVVNSVFCQDKADGLYPDPLDSHSFYHCSNSLTYHKQCPANLVFNPAISVCDWPAPPLSLAVVNSVFCQDKADGLYPDPLDSHSFYHCSNSLTYHKQCPANLVFNPAISVCDWPVVNSAFCQDKADGLYPDPSDSHSFYHCSNSLTYHKQCPANLVFNPAISVCDWPVVNSAFCQDKADGLYPDPSDSHSFYHCSNSLTYHKQCPANLVFNPAISVCDWPAPPLSPAVVNSGFCQDKADGLYPDPSDSHSFYHCSNSLTYHKQCPANLVFNPAISVCDWPGAVAGNVAAATTQATTKSLVNSGFCQDKADGLYPDPSDSHSFYHCSNSLTYHKQCPANLVFNPAISVCDWPGVCAVAGNVAAATTQATTKSLVNSGFCQDKADGLYPDPSDSHSFYHCSNSLTYHKQCPANLVFNPAISVCDWPGTYDYSFETHRLITEIHRDPLTAPPLSPAVVNSGFCQDKADGLYPDPSDSHSFYHCSNSLTYHKQCPANLVFNPAISVCDWPVVNSAFCQDKADGLYPDPSDSHSFYHCSNSLTYHKQCPANLVFNPAISVCDWPGTYGTVAGNVAAATTQATTKSLVNSGFCQDKADGLYPDPSDSHSFYHCSNSLTYHKQCPANLVFNPAISVCDWPVVNSGFCQDKADGLYPDPSDSHSFYHCSNSLTYHKQCPANLVFNPAISVCDWPVVNSGFCQDKADGLYPDPSDSHSFYHCSNSLTYHKQCPANLVFNPAISVCDWPGAVAGNVAAATTQATTKSLVNSGFCQDKADGLYPDPSDSHSFYHCSNSLTYHKQCPANLVFNPAISVCDWPGTPTDSSHRDPLTAPPLSPAVVNSGFCQDKADGMYADPSDSHSFYHCSNSLTYHKQCPANLVFNTAKNRCDWDGTYHTFTPSTHSPIHPLTQPFFCKAKVDGMFADPGNTNAFYHCSNHYTYYKLCQQGLVFNQRLGV
ncbi:uncharacterized protein LOC144952821 [Lampetra fluviatilis]